MSEKDVCDAHMDGLIILTCKHLTNIRTHNILLRISIVCYSFDKKNISEGDAARTCRYTMFTARSTSVNYVIDF